MAGSGAARWSGRRRHRKTLLVVDRSGSGLVHLMPIDVDNERIVHTQCEYTPYEGLKSANQINRK